MSRPPDRCTRLDWIYSTLDKLAKEARSMDSNRDASTSRAQGGWYRQIRVLHPDIVSWRSFEDPWTFHEFFLKDKLTWIKWLMDQRLLNGKDGFTCRHVTGGVQNGIMCIKGNLSTKTPRTAGQFLMAVHCQQEPRVLDTLWIILY